MLKKMRVCDGRLARSSAAFSHGTLLSTIRSLVTVPPSSGTPGCCSCRRTLTVPLNNTAALYEPTRCQHSSSSSSTSSSAAAAGAGGAAPHNPYAQVQVKHPIVQLPARTLWMKHNRLSAQLVAEGHMDEMIGRVKAARAYYQYPSLCAPQIGWNVQLFTLFDGSVYVNPVNLDEAEWRREAAAAGVPWVQYEEQVLERLRAEGKTAFAWEPCASCCFTIHFIERPKTVRLRYVDGAGAEREETLTGMAARMALHELDHLGGVLFTRRVVDADHVVPLEGFTCMSDWSDDYPSLEARSTFLYTLFTPPYHFETDARVTDANLLDRKFEDGIYPGYEFDRQQQIESVAYEETIRRRWRKHKEEAEGGGSGSSGAGTASTGAEGRFKEANASPASDSEEDNEESKESADK